MFLTRVPSRGNLTDVTLRGPDGPFKPKEMDELMTASKALRDAAANTVAA